MLACSEINQKGRQPSRPLPKRCISLKTELPLAFDCGVLATRWPKIVGLGRTAPIISLSTINNTGVAK
jgi:hypothetical protein